MRAAETEGLVAAQAGETKRAIAAHEHALEVATLIYGKDNGALWGPEEMLGATLSKAGEYARALPQFEHALTQREASSGPDHPDVALLLSNMGVCYEHLGEPAKARAAFDRALAIRERTFGKNSPLLLTTLNNFADELRDEGDATTALAYIERAKEIAVRIPGTGHPLYHVIQTTYAETLTSLGKTADARAAFDELLALEDKTSSETRPTTLTSSAQLAIKVKDYKLAHDHASKAIALFEAAGGKDHAELWRPLTALGQAHYALGDTEAARAAFERAIAIGEKARIRAADLVPAREALAKIK
jgi:tetratricopeptide (TPR) repeat protein